MKTVKVRKDHQCDWCQETIMKGETAKTCFDRTGRVSGDGSYFTTYYFHNECPAPEPYKLTYIDPEKRVRGRLKR